MKKLFVLTALLSSTSALAAMQTITLSVPSMNCVTCPITVKKSLVNVDGVEKADVTYATKLAIVTYDDDKTNVEGLVNATSNAGYPSILKD
ncbi:mercury resistance system periplasmic binding protein MerP [Paraglaciecola polaris]|uniref:Periplasmic mercury ion-binding protein n=1 Tax=Paraglaciecola polaris LMG 21857 TaxID=1129793 RepID=K6ZUA1_9ALTE|nr:mercury resistance system periplasmic binding protein MerP [Paraglaciecola polaris]GAC33857.1 periplasmic mercuric ion binding protein [Paraglaciecola polaris LMG 21857]